MLVLSRKPGERIVIGEGAQQIIVEVVRVRGAVAVLGFVADPQIKIMREELVGTKGTGDGGQGVGSVQS